MCVARDKISKNINFKRHAGTLHTSRSQWDCLFSRNGLSHSVTEANTGWGENRSSLESREPSYRVPLNLPWMYAHRCQPPGFQLKHIFALNNLRVRRYEMKKKKWSKRSCFPSPRSPNTEIAGATYCWKHRTDGHAGFHPEALQIPFSIWRLTLCLLDRLCLRAEQMVHTALT